MPSKPFRFVVLISGNGTNLQAIIDALEAKEFTAELCAVMSNQAQAYGLERAKQAGIPTHVFDKSTFGSKQACEAAMIAELDQYQPDLIVLAGFMQILSPTFVDKYYPKIINIHPSLLPKYRGLNTHERVITAGETKHGTTVHFVTKELDAGSTIFQAELTISPADTPDTLQARVQSLEHNIYPAVISWFATNRIVMKNDQVFLDDQPLPICGLRRSDIPSIS